MPNKSTQLSQNDAKVALKAVCRLLDLWQCNETDKAMILGDTPDKLIGSDISDDTMLRLSALLNIHSALRTIFSNPDNYYGFVHQRNDNAPFNGLKPIDLMNSREGILTVMNHLYAHLR